MTSFFKS